MARALILALLLVVCACTCQAQDCQASAMKEINRYRALHNVDAMTWDDKLAAQAQVTANDEANANCNQADDGFGQHIGLETLGHQLFESNGPTWSSANACGAGLNTMYRRVVSYTFSSTPADDNEGTGSDAYALMMWKSTTSIGCAIANGTWSDGDKCSMIICHLPSRNLSPMSATDKNQAYLDNIQGSALKAVGDACKDASLAYLNKIRARHGAPEMSWDDRLAVAALDKASVAARNTSCTFDSLVSPRGTEGVRVIYDETSNANCTAGIEDFYSSGLKAYNFSTTTPYEANYNVDVPDIFAELLWKNTTRVGCGAAANQEGPCYRLQCYFPDRNVPEDNVSAANEMYLANAPAALPNLTVCQAAAVERHKVLRAAHGAASLEWDDSLADAAQMKAASSARIGCSDPDNTFAPGQEGVTFKSMNWSAGSDPCGPAIDTLYNRGKKAYNFSAGAPVPQNNTPEGVFARLVWASATRMGCGAGVNYQSGCSVVVCSYPDRGLPSDGQARKQAFLDNVKVEAVAAPGINNTYRQVQPPVTVLPGLPGSTSTDSKASVGPIIGGVVGGVAVLALLVAGFLWWRRRNNTQPMDHLPAKPVVPVTPKPKPLVPGYQWVNHMAEGRTFLQAGVNDVQLDTQKQLSAVDHTWCSPVLQLTPDQVAEQIQLLSDMPMGSGACGHVYKCVWECRFPGALLAAKILPRTARFYELAWQSFQHETNILKAINHPNIVRIYGFCLEQPTVCIIMELLDFSVDRLVSTDTTWLAGKLTDASGATSTIATQLTTSQRDTAVTNTSLTDGSVVVTLNDPSTSLSMKRVLRIAIDVASGLEHLHAGAAGRPNTAPATPPELPDAPAEELPEEGTALDEDQVAALPSPASGQKGVVIHRDIKPDNMLVNANGQTKLCDFGISRETIGTNLATKHEGAGTDRYMAPELLVYRNNTANSGVVGKKVDIYSLGIVLYELVSQRAISKQEALLVPSGKRPALVSKGEPETVEARLRELECSNEVLKAVEAIITRCWHHLPNKRPTATELKQALLEVRQMLPA